MLAHLAALCVGEAVEPQAVLFRVDLRQQVPFERFHLHQVDMALEHGLLDPLAVGFAHFGNTPQAAPTCAGFGVYVVAHDDEHTFPYLYTNGR